MNKFISLVVAVFLLSSCETISSKTEDLKNPRHECPEASERTLSDIFCKEKK